MTAQTSLTVQEPTPSGHYIGSNGHNAFQDMLAAVRETALNTVGDFDAHAVYANRIVDMARNVVKTGEAIDSLKASQPEGGDEFTTDLIRMAHGRQNTWAYAVAAMVGADSHKIAPCDMIALSAYLVALAG